MFDGLLISSVRGVSAPPQMQHPLLAACTRQAQAKIPWHQLKPGSVSRTACRRDSVPEERAAGCRSACKLITVAHLQSERRG